MTTLSSRLLEHAAMHDDERRRYGGQHQAQWTADLREAAGLLAHVVQAEPDDKTLTLIGAQWHLNMLTGEDRADMLAFGRAVWAAALSAAQAPAAVQQASINAAGIDASEQRVDSVSAVQPVPAGYWLAPDEPSEAMVLEGNRVTWPYPSAPIYRAMRAAHLAADGRPNFKQQR